MKKKSNPVSVALVAALMVASVLGLGVLVARPAARATATRLDHAIGAASAAVVVDEWSDFE
jgi:hypothetical protein